MSDSIPVILRKIADYLEQQAAAGQAPTFAGMGYQEGGSVAENAARTLWEYAGSNDPVAFAFAKHKFDVSVSTGPGKLRTVTPLDEGYYEVMMSRAGNDPFAFFGVDSATMARWLAAILQLGGASLPVWYAKLFPAVVAGQNNQPAGGGKL